VADVGERNAHNLEPSLTNFLFFLSGPTLTLPLTVPVANSIDMIALRISPFALPAISSTRDLLNLPNKGKFADTLLDNECRAFVSNVSATGLNLTLQ
jgi:hypothetical protein